MITYLLIGLIITSVCTILIFINDDPLRHMMFDGKWLSTFFAILFVDFIAVCLWPLAIPCLLSEIKEFWKGL